MEIIDTEKQKFGIKSIIPQTGSLNSLIKLMNLSPDFPRKKREKTQITNVKNERENITLRPIDIESIIKEWSYAHKFDNFDEMDKFLERHKLSKLTWGNR